VSSPRFIVLDFTGSWYISRKVYATKKLFVYWYLMWYVTHALMVWWWISDTVRPGISRIWAPVVRHFGRPVAGQPKETAQKKKKCSKLKSLGKTSMASITKRMRVWKRLVNVILVNLIMKLCLAAVQLA